MAEQHAEYAERLLQRADEMNGNEDAGVSAMSGGEHVIDLAKGFANVALVHATLAAIRDA